MCSFKDQKSNEEKVLALFNSFSGCKLTNFLSDETCINFMYLKRVLHIYVKEVPMLKQWNNLTHAQMV